MSLAKLQSAKKETLREKGEYHARNRFVIAFSGVLLCFDFREVKIKFISSTGGAENFLPAFR